MATIYPSIHRPTTCRVLVEYPQVQDRLFREGEFRLSRWKLRSVGHKTIEPSRGVPSDSYLPGAPFLTESVLRSDQAVIPMSTDLSDR